MSRLDTVGSRTAPGEQGLARAQAKVAGQRWPAWASGLVMRTSPGREGLHLSLPHHFLTLFAVKWTTGPGNPVEGRE